VLEERAKRGEGGAVRINGALAMRAVIFGIEPQDDDLAESPALSATLTE
jgi:hypothetical protein